MFRLTIILSFWMTFSYGQSNIDYALYSKVIDSFITVGINLNINTTEVVVMNKFVPLRNQISNYTATLRDSNDTTVYMTSGYDQLKIGLLKDTIVKNAILSLERGFFETPTLNEQKFSLNCKTKSITNTEFRNFFNGNKKKRIENGWKRFYRMFPGSHAIFEFSKIIYSGDYACFYTSRQSGGLSGRGDIVIMKKDNDIWCILTYFNIWMS